ncbi:MAG: 16S rRNA (cytidine(1402)-2'-O)-methyltransferase [Dehalococcoidia bacterium]|nr:16S rRNA (cytidine(1402)-2'-O)-methyltransferase [Dehalococcoidia bacterium]
MIVKKSDPDFRANARWNIIPSHMGTLYVVATPIGNLEDVTLRALRTLREVCLIASEDTRKTRKLLAAHSISTSITSYNEVNKRAKLGYVLSCLQDRDVAIVSEAGMPGLSDPGYELIGSAIAAGICVVPIPGPSVVLTALAVSGLPIHQFAYLGFLPRTRGARRRAFSAIEAEPRTVVLFEAPHRIRESLKDMMEVLGDRRLAVCREMTKIHEEVFRGKVSDAIEHFANPRGEFTLVVAGKEALAEQRDITDDLCAEVISLCGQGMRLKEAVACVAAASGVSKRALYDRCKPKRSTGQEKNKCAVDVCR